MIFLFLFACMAHKTTLTGIVDYIDKDSCTIELSTGEIVLFKSKICSISKEGDVIKFYVSKK